MVKIGYDALDHFIQDQAQTFPWAAESCTSLAGKGFVKARVIVVPSKKKKKPWKLPSGTPATLLEDAAWLAGEPFRD